MSCITDPLQLDSGSSHQGGQRSTLCQPTSPRHGQSVSILAYADDLVIMSKSADGLQRLLSTASIMADKLQLKFKPENCASLSIVHGNVIHALSEEQHYRYLGVPNESLESLAVKMGEHLQQIDSSLLAPWQILDAYHTFIQSFAAYTLCASDCQKKHLKKLCGELVKIAWKVWNLPTRGTTNFVFADC